MTPQEKAKMLIEKMYNAKDPFRQYPMCFDTAKQCALIAVEEILNNNCGSHMSELEIADKNEIYCDEYFWQDVKSEIEKL